nr:olfactory receptor 2 [Gregopimpla kuwanae]
MGLHLDTTNSHNRLEKVSNKNYESDVNHSLLYTRWFFTFLGIWPYITPEPTRLERIVSIIMMPFCCIIMVLVPIPSVAHITMREVDRMEIVMLMGPLGFYATNIVKYFILMFRLNTIKLCIQHMKSDWRRLEDENDREIMMNNLRVGHGLTVVFTVFMQSGGLFFHAVMPLCTGSVINELNKTVRPLAYPGTDIFFDSQASFVYEIVFCGICVCAFFHYTFVAATFNLISIFVTHTCGQIEILLTKLSGLLKTRAEENSVSSVSDRLNLIIRWHVRVLRFLSWIDEALCEICLMEVVSATLSICLLEYYCMMEWSKGVGVAIITYILILLSLALNIFIYCHVGELIKDKCYQVGKAAYMIEWYKLPGKTEATIIMIIAMAYYPRKLTAGGMIELSITTFGSVRTFMSQNKLKKSIKMTKSFLDYQDYFRIPKHVTKRDVISNL